MIPKLYFLSFFSLGLQVYTYIYMTIYNVYWHGDFLLECLVIFNFFSFLYFSVPYVFPTIEIVCYGKQRKNVNEVRSYNKENGKIGIWSWGVFWH